MQERAWPVVVDDVVSWGREASINGTSTGSKKYASPHSRR